MAWMRKTSRAEWQKRVERWQDSGFTAKEFASELNVSPHVLARWKRRLQCGEPLVAETQSCELETAPQNIARNC
jgi:transposase-like protein